MPQRLLGAYIDMMPVLKAQEFLAHYQANVLASGHIKESSARVALKRWETQANKFSKDSKNSPKNAAHLQAIMASMGVPVRSVKNG